MAALHGDLRIAHANAPFLEIFGRGLADIRNRHVSRIFGNEEICPQLHRILTNDGTERMSTELGTMEMELPEKGLRHLKFSVRRPENLRALLLTVQDVTEDALSGVSIQEGAARFSSAFDSLRIGLAQLDAAGRLIDVNKYFCRMLGYDPGRLLGRTPKDITHPDDRDADWNRIRRLLKGRVRFHENEKRILRKDGESLWVRVSATSVHDEKGQVSGIVAAIVDITERMRAEGALQEQRDFLDSLVKSAPVIILLLNPDGTVHYVNPHFEQLTGFTLQEIRDKNWFDTCLPERTRSETRALFEGAMEKEPTRGNVDLLLTRNGDELEIEWSDTVLRDGKGRIMSLLAIGLDVTDKRRNEQRLRDSERRFRIMADGTPVIIWATDASGRLEFVNKASIEFFGTTAETLQAEGWQRFLHPDDISDYVAAFRGAIASQEAFEAEARVRHRDGSWRWCRSCAMPRFSPEGRFLGMVGSSPDISEQKRNAEKVEMLMGELSHRVKNLLTIIQAVAARTATEENPTLFAERFNARLAGLAASHDLLVQSEWRGVDMDSLARSQLAHFQDLIGSRVYMAGPVVRFRPPAAQALGMALHELATNAAKYGALSNETGTVRLVWEILTEGEQCVFKLSWTEKDGPPVQPPEKRGFGYMVLVRTIEHQFDGSARLDYDPAGLVWEAEVPADRVLEDSSLPP